MLKVWIAKNDIEMGHMLENLREKFEDMYVDGEIDFTPIENKIRVIYLQDSLPDNEIGDWLQIDDETGQIVI